MLRTHHTPAWVYLGGLVLTVIAGAINAVGFLGIHHQALSHMTGSVTTIGMELAQGRFDVALHALLILGSFFAGCLVSGAVIRQATLQLGRRYGVVLSLEAVALLLAVHFLRLGAHAGDYLAALGCGLQNAMVTSYSGATMRTTHMTGMVTDLGIACGHFLRGERVDWYRFKLYGVLFSGFFAGGVIGTFGFQQFGYDTLLFPAALSGIAGGGYVVVKHLERRKRDAGRPSA